MQKVSMYTIGHGVRSSTEFLNILNRFDIKYIIDVRSFPYSKFNPQFDKDEFSKLLAQNGIRYVFMGDSLGGRPIDNSCYDSEGKVDYDMVKNKEFFLTGIERLKKAYKKNIPVALMCSEAKPTECHRSKLIGKTLLEHSISLNHIDESGTVKDQISVINELNKGKSDIDLFGNKSNTTSRKGYR